MSGHPSALADVLVVGGGPAGASTALYLARAGHRVIVVDHNPADVVSSRPGALLSPRALGELERGEIPLDVTSGGHRVERVRFTYPGRSGATSSVRWPANPHSPTALDYGMIVDRTVLDARLIDIAVAAGAEVLSHVNAIAPIVERGFVRGAVVDDGSKQFELRSSYTVIADGANSGFGRELGTFRHQSWPYAIGHRGRYRSQLDRANEVEFVIGLRDRVDVPVAGHAWMLPCGDGTVVIGLMIMSTSPSFQVISPPRLLERIVNEQAAHWFLDPQPLTPTTGSRLPLGRSIGPIAGPTYLVVGDAAGAANPLTGAGIESALDTGRMAGVVLAEAIESGSAAALQRYPQLVDQTYGRYYKLGRLTNRMLASPPFSTQMARLTARNGRIAAIGLRIGANLLRPGHAGAAETLVKAGLALNAISPNA